MKKVITTIALALSIVTLTNAQIKKPKVKMNTTPIATNTQLQEVKVNNLGSLKTIEDFEKLNIPVQQMTKELLNKKPTQTWKISPMHLIDGNLKLNYFYGSINPEVFSYYGTDANYFNVLASFPASRLISGSNNFPLSIAFRASGGVEYRLKIKLSGGAGNNDKIYILRSVNDTYSLVAISDQGNKEFNYVFKEDTSETVYIGISSILKESEKFNRPFYSWLVSSLSEIRIDRIN